MFSRRVAIQSIGILGLGIIDRGNSHGSGNSGDPIIEELTIRCMGSELNVRWEPAADHDVPLERIRDSVEKLMEKWNLVLSDYDDESEASLLTQSKNVGKWQSVSQEFAEAMNASQKWFQISEGAFDVTCGAVSALRRKRRKVSQEEWQAAIRTIGWDKLDWNESTRAVRLRSEGTRFDFGGIGKGIAIDKAGEMLESWGIKQYILNFSGNLRAGSPPTGRAGWPVEIEALNPSPLNLSPSGAEVPTASKSLYRLRISKLSMATSGDQFQSFQDWKSETKEDRSSHILDPKDGSGLRGGQLATVMTQSAADADAAATALCVHLRRKNEAWLKKLALQAPGFYGVAQEVAGQQISHREFGGFSQKVKFEES